MLIAFTILIGLAAGFSAKAEELRLKVTTKQGNSTYLAVTMDRQILAVVCKRQLVKSVMSWDSKYEADVVFPNDGQLEWSSYRDNGANRVSTGPRPAYRPLSSENAKLFCDDPTGWFTMTVTDFEASLQKVGMATAASFDVTRRAL